MAGEGALCFQPSCPHGPFPSLKQSRRDWGRQGTPTRSMSRDGQGRVSPGASTERLTVTLGRMGAPGPLGGEQPSAVGSLAQVWGTWLRPRQPPTPGLGLLRGKWSPDTPRDPQENTRAARSPQTAQAGGFWVRSPWPWGRGSLSPA